MIDNIAMIDNMEGRFIMGKKILVITGSPRAEGNSNTLVSAFASGAIAAGHEVEIFDAGHAKMDGCHADKSCEKRGRCGMKDDGQKMGDLMMWADALVLASPLYWKGFTSQIKIAIDHFYPFSFPKGKETIHIKETGLIATAMMPDESAFDCMVGEYEHINAVLGWESSFKLLCPGLDGAEDVSRHPEYISLAVKYGMEM